MAKKLKVKLKVDVNKNELRTFKPETAKISIKGAKTKFLKNEEPEGHADGTFWYEISEIDTTKKIKKIQLTATGLFSPILLADLERGINNKIKTDKEDEVAPIVKEAKEREEKIKVEEVKEIKKEEPKQVAKEEKPTPTTSQNEVFDRLDYALNLIMIMRSIRTSNNK